MGPGNVPNVFQLTGQWLSGFGSWWRNRYYDLFEVAKPAKTRTYRGRHNRDEKQVLNWRTRTEALSVGRWLYANEGYSKGAVDVLALLTVGTGLLPGAQVTEEDAAGTGYTPEEIARAYEISARRVEQPNLLDQALDLLGARHVVKRAPFDL
jgi:hypothetical protein